MGQTMMMYTTDWRFLDQAGALNTYHGRFASFADFAGAAAGGFKTVLTLIPNVRGSSVPGGRRLRT